jgi:eukaryotic-like serine/threonine-protein kinase
VDQLGSYRLRKRLAVGGMGEVYLGEKIGPEGFVKPVVLKCVLPQLAKDRAFVQLFLDEARLAALLNHPNIAQVYDFGLVDDIYYIAMEYVPGYTVDDIRRKLRSIHSYMPLEHIACIASQVCQGLQYAHTLTDANGIGLGLVHRDVSPHNLIVSIDGGVKIVDFGIAKARAGLTRVQAKGAVGKFGYMSPEQSRGETVDGRSDVFSLGVCLWELITNERLHDPKLDRAPDYSPRNPVRSVTEIRGDVPRQFEQIMETALAIQSEDRYPSCQEMHLALERFLAAMTHYAGQSALAKYIKDLVEGKVENPELAASGSVVEPAVRGGTAPRASGELAGLEAAKKYEEVFGVTMDSGRARPRAVPKSWQMKRPDGEAVRTPSQPSPAAAGSRVVELKNPTNDLELQTDDQPRSSRTRSGGSRPAATPAPSPHPHREPRRIPWGIALLVFAVVGVSLGGYLYSDKLFALVGNVTKRDHEKPKLMSIYRIISDPPGATVLLDGTPKEAPTPFDIELIPDVEYEITVKLPRYASKSATVKASVGTEVRPIQFKLAPAATLKVTSDPPGAVVAVDGRVMKNTVTPATFDDVTANQELRVTAEIKGMPPMTKRISIAPGKQKALHFPLNN